MPGREEIYTDKEFQEIKVELTLNSIFGRYNRAKEVLLDSVVSKMLANSPGDMPKGGGYVNKLEKYSNEFIDAEKYVELIDELMGQLDDRSFVIIESCYTDLYKDPDGIERRRKKDKEIYEQVMYMSESHYYRLKARAKLKMYHIFRKNIKKIKKWE